MGSGLNLHQANRVDELAGRLSPFQQRGAPPGMKLRRRGLAPDAAESTRDQAGDNVAYSVGCGPAKSQGTRDAHDARDGSRLMMRGHPGSGLVFLRGPNRPLTDAAKQATGQSERWSHDRLVKVLTPDPNKHAHRRTLPISIPLEIRTSQTS